LVARPRSQLSLYFFSFSTFIAAVSSMSPEPESVSR
jgi:hypothetical protein